MILNSHKPTTNRKKKTSETCQKPNKEMKNMEEMGNKNQKLRR